MTQQDTISVQELHKNIELARLSQALLTLSQNMDRKDKEIEALKEKLALLDEGKE